MSFAVLILSGTSVLAAADSTDKASQLIAALASPDVAQRRAAIDAVQTLDDPAIPAACLPLLNDVGLSIRRQAARAIGSRFQQISAEQKPAYIKALKTCAADGPADVTLICQRAIGLLTEHYEYPSFSVGPHEKWVLYERRRLPVIAPVKGGKHTLLLPSSADFGFAGESDLLKLAITNESAATLFSPHWHPSGEALAFTPLLQRRFFTPVCIWVAGEHAIKVLEPRSLKPLLPARYPAWGTTSEFSGWEGNKAIVRIYDCQNPDGSLPPNDPGVRISYDIRTQKLAREDIPTHGAR